MAVDTDEARALADSFPTRISTSRYTSKSKKLLRQMADELDQARIASAVGPRGLSGEIAGPGGPYDRDAVIVDATDAVLLDYSEVTLVETFRDGQGGGPSLALLMKGRINKRTDRASVLFLLNADGAAAVATELIGIAGRAKGFAPEFLQRVQERMEAMP